MNSSNYRICLDLQAPHGAVELNMKQGDSHRRIYITLTDGGRFYEPAGCCPVFTAKKPDGTVIYNRCRVEDQTVIYDVTPQTTAAPGRVSCELRLYSPEPETDSQGIPIPETGRLITSAAFAIAVYPQVCQDGDVVSSAPEATALEALVADGKALVDTVQTKLESGAFVGEKGDKGDQGDKGEKGDPGEVNIDDGGTGDDHTWSARYLYDCFADCVQYHEQDHTPQQQAQARKNIGAISDGDSIGALEIVNKLHVDQEADIDFHDNVVKGVAAGEADTDAVNKKQLDDAQRTLVDKLCPAFTESGSVVTCEPVEGYPLQVVSQIALKQSGSGDPTPDNIRPITGHTAVQLSQSNESEERTFALDLGRTVYGGSLDWSTGLLTIQWARKTMTSFTKVSTPGWASYVLTTKMDYENNSKTIVQCSHYKGGVWVSTIPDNYVYAANDTTLSFRDKAHFGSLEDANAYLEEQNAAGTPVQICYKLKTPTTVQLTPQEICALAGVNTVCSDTGDTTVTGREDPRAVLERLTNAVISLGGNV